MHYAPNPRAAGQSLTVFCWPTIAPVAALHRRPVPPAHYKLLMVGGLAVASPLAVRAPSWFHLMCYVQVDREEREWCAGLPAHVFVPWVQRLVAQEAPGITAPPLPVR